MTSVLYICAGNSFFCVNFKFYFFEGRIHFCNSSLKDLTLGKIGVKKTICMKMKNFLMCVSLPLN